MQSLIDNFHHDCYRILVIDLINLIQFCQAAPPHRLHR